MDGSAVRLGLTGNRADRGVSARLKPQQWRPGAEGACAVAEAGDRAPAPGAAARGASGNGTHRVRKGAGVSCLRLLVLVVAAPPFGGMGLRPTGGRVFHAALRPERGQACSWSFRAGGLVMKIVPGIHRIGGNSMINAYLVEQARGGDR